MASKQLLTPEEQRRRMAEAAWLNYFNNVLYEQNMITEQQRNQLTNKIASRKPSTAKNNDRGMER